MEITAEKVTLERVGRLYEYHFQALVSWEGMGRVEVFKEYTMSELQKKGAPALMPYAEMALALGRQYCRDIAKEY